MIDRRTIFLDTARGRQHAHRMIDAAPQDYVCRIGQRTRTDLQNRKLWPSISDIQSQVPDMRMFNANDAKLRFMNAFGVEMRYLPTLENNGMFPVGLSSSTLSVEQFSGLLELLLKYGAEHGVVWSAPDRGEPDT